MNSRNVKHVYLFPIVLVLLWAMVSGTAWGATLKVHIIDVGQGDSELIVSPTGITVLIDAGDNGKGNAVVMPYLNSLGITDLDYIVASHYHSDHIGGIDEVVSGLGGISSVTTAVYDRGGSYGTQTYSDYESAVSSKRTTITPGQVITLGGGAKLTCIAASGKTKNGTVYSGTDENNLSVVLKLDYLDFQVYFGGDSSTTMEGATASLTGNIDVYKVSHHGSDSASGQSFLDAVQPDISTIPVGVNSYGHPSEEVHTRLVNIGCYIYQTETGNQAPPTGYGEVANGNFKIESGGYSYTVSGASLSTATYATDGSYSGATAHVVFSEVLYDSWVYYETEGEWVELYNPTASTVNIGGWTISDSSQTYTVPSGTSLESGGYIVIADGSTEFTKRYGCPPHLSDLSVRMNNDGEYLILKNGSGTIIDQVAWESGGSSIIGWGSSTLPYADDGKSIVRANLTQDTDTYTDWLSNRTPAPNTSGDPEISLNLSTMNFQLLAGDNTDSQTLTVRNSGCGTLNWSVSDNAAWMECSPTSGSGTAGITVTVNGTGLAVGNYTGTITVTDPNASNSPQTVTVNLTVTNSPSPQISLNPGTLSFDICEGSTDTETFSISNSGYGTLSWSVSDNVQWLTCNPASGTNSGTVTVTVNGSSLGAGVYTGVITVSSTNAFNSPQTMTVTVTVQECGQPEISLNRTQLNYGAAHGQVTGAQEILVSNSGEGDLNWTAAPSTNWLTCTPSSGSGTGVVSISVNANRLGLAVGTYTGYVTISDPNAVNSPQTVNVTLKIYSADDPPMGTFETPVHNSAVCSSIPVTGWVIDDVDIESVKIYRHEGNGLAYIGDALLVEGARPDVEQAYSDYPKSYQAGWGYMMLTNFLPNQGNGTFTIEAKVRDITGHEVSLGTKTISCDNANAQKPFGAIDTPGQGGTAAGSTFINWGWVLTPQPERIPVNGSTINVYVDGVNLGHPKYNIYRSDIASLFPGYANSNGAAGYFVLDTTAYSNGIHTIQWTATDSGGNTDGIGSRYFNVQNSDNRQKARSSTFEIEAIGWGDGVPIRAVKGYNPDSEPQPVYPDEYGNLTVEIRELERLEIHLQGITEFESLLKYDGYLVVGNQLRPLPAGSTLDREKGIYYWQPGVGFYGEYRLVFISTARPELNTQVRINIVPRYSLPGN